MKGRLIPVRALLQGQPALANTASSTSYAASTAFLLLVCAGGIALVLATPAPRRRSRRSRR